MKRKIVTNRPFFLIIIVLTCMYSSFSKAQFIASPLFGINKGVWKGSKIGPSYDVEMQGESFSVIYGVKVIYRHEYSYLGLDYIRIPSSVWSYSKSGVINNDDLWKDEVDVKEDMASVLLGIYLTDTFILFVGYLFYDSAKFEANFDPNSTPYRLTGGGYRVGVAKGFGAEGKLKINFEYSQSTYNKLNGIDLPTPYGGDTYDTTNLLRLLIYLSYDI